MAMPLRMERIGAQSANQAAEATFIRFAHFGASPFVMYKLKTSQLPADELFNDLSVR